MDVAGWLRNLGLEQYEAVFRDNAIDETILQDLSESHLRELGFPLGARIKLLKAIAALRVDTQPTGFAADGAPADVPVDAAERRQVTVMFADLVGSTALSARMDPEDLREVISAYQRCVTETVRRFGGFVAKYMGDGVLVYFGYPQAHEDDAERAVRAALELIPALSAVKTRAALQARVGIATDEYLRLVLKKTAWYSFIHPMRIGALVANADDQNLDRFDRFGFLLGVAFQITDDVLNLVGDVGRYGKEIDGDLWEGKRTIVLTHALGHADRVDRAWMASFLARPRERRLPREVLRLHQILARSGSIAWAQQSAATFAEAAVREFEGCAFAGVPESPDLNWLRACVDFLVQRYA